MKVMIKYTCCLLLGSILSINVQAISNDFNNDNARIIKLLMETDSDLDSSKYSIIVKNKCIKIKGPILSNKQYKKILDIALSLPDINDVIIN